MQLKDLFQTFSKVRKLDTRLPIAYLFHGKVKVDVVFCFNNGLNAFLLTSTQINGDTKRSEYILLKQPSIKSNKSTSFYRYVFKSKVHLK